MLYERSIVARCYINMRNDLVLSSRLDLRSLREQYKRSQRIHIPNILKERFADKIYQTLSKQKQWNLCWNDDGKHFDMDYEGVVQWDESQRKQLLKIIETQAENKFQYHYAAIPIYDIYKNKVMPNHFFNDIYEFVNSEEFLALVRKITSLDAIQYADVQATRFTGGHFLNEHNDNVVGKNRLAAFVLNMTRNWNSNWGGALVFNEEQPTAYFPAYNALNIFTVPQKHLVSYIPPYVTKNRHSLTGWLRY